MFVIIYVLVYKVEFGSKTKLIGFSEFFLVSLFLYFFILGRNGDDFLVVGLRDGRVVYSYNLGFGIVSVSSDFFDRSFGIYVVRLGRFF